MKIIRTKKYSKFASLGQTPSGAFLEKIRDIIEISAYGWRGTGELSEQQALKECYKRISDIITNFSPQLSAINPRIPERMAEIRDKASNGIRSPSPMEKQRTLLIMSENLITMKDLFNSL